MSADDKRTIHEWCKLCRENRGVMPADWICMACLRNTIYNKIGKIVMPDAFCIIRY